MNLNQITVPSLDVVSAIEFYKTLGLKLIVHSHDNYARLELPEGDSTLSIHKVDELSNGSGVILYFECESLEEKVEQLKSVGIRFDGEVVHQSWLWYEAHLSDLDGNRIILFRAGDNRKNPPWRLNNPNENI